MKKLLILLLACLLLLCACGSNVVPGSEQSCSGIVTDRGMSVLQQGDRHGRAYIIIEAADSSELCFWLAPGCDTAARIGDYVIIESATEAHSGLPLALRVSIE